MKFKPTAKQISALKSYARAVAASAITLGLALVANLKPEYAVLLGALAAPAVKWADKAEKDFGLGSQK